MKSYDKVSEAYYGGMGETFARITRERIHWICSQVQGDFVLDVGCSQGITEFLLAREGKNVIGIDVEKSAIDYAIDALQNESDAVKKRIKFLNINIFDYVPDRLFDSVILAEVLEHFSTSSPLLERVTGMLKENGTLIITVPFGINNYHDHKKTYYLFNLLDEISSYVQLRDIKFFGKWIGLVTIKTQHDRDIDYPALVRQLENAFYNVEQSWINAVEEKKRMIDQLKEMLDKANKEIAELKSKLATELTRNNIVLDKLREENEKLKTEYEDAIKNNQEQQKLIEEYKEQIETKNKALLERLDSEEKTLEELKAAILRFNHLEAKYAHVCKKYDLLRNSKLGRLTINYWKYRKRIPKEW